MSLKDNLRKIIQGEVSDDDETLTAYSRDASIFEIKPQVVVSPKDSSDLEALVKFVSQNSQDGLSLTPRSAGTDMTGGAINDSIILDMTKYFNKTIEVAGDFVQAQPGVYYRDFEKETLKYGLIMPSYPASREICTVGGMVATNAGGEKDLSYGQTKDWVKTLKVVLSDGNEYIFQALTADQLDKKIAQKDPSTGSGQSFEGKIYSEVYNLIKNNRTIIEKARPKVLKNSTGYFLWDIWDGQTFDLSKLFTGSQGTLGIITEINFQLVKPKPISCLLVIFLPDLEKLDQIINHVLQFKPESFECYDIETLKLAIKHFLDLTGDFKQNSRLSAIFQFVPDIIKNLLGKMPKLTMLANFTGDCKQEVMDKCKLAQQSLKPFKLRSEIKDTGSSAEKYWIIRHKSFGLLRKYSKNGQASSFIDDIIVKPEHLPQFLPKLNSIITPYKNKMVYTLTGHIGDGNFHIIPLMDLSKEDVRAIIPELMEKVFKLVFEYGGSMSGEHNDGLIRGPYLEKMYGNEIYQLFKEVKQIFDPKNIFNPHKKTDAAFKYSLDHMAKN